MTRPLDLSRPVRCARCGEKFTRTHGRERLCLTCKRPAVRTLGAVRQAAAARVARAAMESGLDCQYPACGHKLADRAVNVMAGTCQPKRHG